MQYEDWEDAKRGLVSKHKFVKMHVVVDASGKRIMSCEVTRGTAHDSPRFRQMFAIVPDGTGCVMLDAAYDAYENYRDLIRYYFSSLPTLLFRPVSVRLPALPATATFGSPARTRCR